MSGKGLNQSRSVAQQEVARDLLLPDEVATLGKTAKDHKGVMQAGENLVFVGGMPPIRDTMCPYFMDEKMVKRTQIPVPKLNVEEGEKLNN